MYGKVRRLSESNRSITTKRKAVSKSVVDRLPQLTSLEKRVNETVIGQENVVIAVSIISKKGRGTIIVPLFFSFSEIYVEKCQKILYNNWQRKQFTLRTVLLFLKAFTK